ncbi:MAG: penicillin-binding transpeptidase domain-containing protein, partial [Deltaproteobacteria bacterium]
LLDTSAQKLKEAFDNGYIASTIPVAVAKNIDMKKAIALEELKLDFPSIVIQPHPLRDYPFGKLACHVTGYLNEIDHWRLTRLSDYGYKTKDIVGFGGIEEKYDYYLREEDGALSVEVDHQGRFMRVVGFKPPRNGKDIQLTLDLRLQKIVEDKLADKPGSVILMNPDNGEVLAMASSPDFYPSAFIKKSGDYISRLVTDQEAPLVNRAISGVYPAGSIFKPITATAALESGKIDLSTVFTCTGGIFIGEQEFSCWSRHGEQNLFSAMAHSCNTFFYRTGLLAGAQRMHDYAVRLGLARITAVDLPYESAGFVPSPLWKRIHRFKGWFSGDTANLSIGQGDLLVTPIQMTRMAAVFANKGMLVTPYLVKAVGGRDICSNQRKISRIALKENTIAYIREGMRMAVSDPTGTASVLSGLATPVAGKTGTVQVPHGQPHAWFVGFFPYKNPRFVICVFLEHGGSGEASCILARQIIEMMTQEGLI